MRDINIIDQKKSANYIDFINEAFAYYEILQSDEGDSINFNLLEYNNSFENLIGCKCNVDSVPDLEQILLKLYKKLKLNKQPKYIFYFSKKVKKYFKIMGSIPFENRLAILIVDNTEIINDLEKDNVYKHLFDNSRNSILFMSVDGEIINANKEAINTYGYSYDELIGMNVKDLRPASTISDFDKQFSQAMTKGILFETKHIKKDRTVFSVEVSSQNSVVAGENIIMSIIQDISHRKNMEKKLEQLANYDFLTNIPNRAYLINNFKIMSESALRNNYQLAFFFFDVDRFKSINDNFGHDVGDKVLKETTKRINSCIKKTDLLARVGGDEFALIQTQVKSISDIKNQAEKLVLNCNKPYEIDNYIIPMSISIGISVFPDDSNDMDTIMGYADQAMYFAKHKDGCNYMFHNSLTDIKN